MKVTDSPSGEANDQGDLAGVVNPDANGAADTSVAADTQGANKPEPSLDDVIKAAIKKDTGAADTPADGESGQDTKSDEATDEVPVEKTDAEKEAEEDAKVPFHKHPRWQKKLERERELVGKVSTYEQEIEGLRPKAERLDQIGHFMKDAGLTPDEMSEGMEIMRLMKLEPAKALEALSKHIEGLEVASGKRFPTDIQSKLEAGAIDAEAAAELTQARFAARANETRAEQVTQELQTDRSQQHRNAISAAVTTWEQDTRARDPDYAHKQSFITDRTRVLAMQNPPKTPDDAVMIAKQAYDDVSAQMKRIAPQPKPTPKAVTSDQSSTRSAAAPQSLMDIVRQSVAR